MIGKTKILTGLAAVAVIGSAAVPFVASAQQAGIPAQTLPATAPDHGGPRGTALATALGVTPEALTKAIEAARAATPKLTVDQFKDKAARDANHTAFETALATNLGITLEKLQAAEKSAMPAGGEHKGPGGPAGPGSMHGPGHEALAKALGIEVATLTEAEKAVRDSLPKPTPGTRPDKAAMDALKTQHDTALAAKLGISIDALKAAQTKVRAEAEGQHQAREQQMLSTVLAKAVADGKITQAKADELKAQIAAGGDSAKAARENLRTLLGAPDRPQRGPGGPGGHGGPRGDSNHQGPAKAGTPSA
ncbi:MAG: hypothetical protein EPO65_12200 [Dehalococcoidia bacterium]|nr:MAG: hypothetical protein EPO65_12200 [Dehalococcoidia bacterium]